ncbi:MAG: cell wall hydrolase [Lachnospiraceae bacterium]|nr:cell wall hydrolase [Lachnospiraceae bacterium]
MVFAQPAGGDVPPVRVSVPEKIYKDKVSELEKELKEKQQEKDEAEDALQDTKEGLDDLKSAHYSLKSQLDDLTEQLTEVSERLEDLEGKIDRKERDIAHSEDLLEAARLGEAEQYAAMKQRIKFLYESGHQSWLDLLLSAESLGAFLNQADYIKLLEAYDRRMLQEFQETHRKAEQAKTRLESEKEDLDALFGEAAAEQAKVMTLVGQTSELARQYEGEISEAEQEALDYEEQIAQQESDIAELRKKIQEEKEKSALAANSEWRDISDVRFDEGDRYLLANLIYCEAGNQPYAGQIGVGAVVINRVRSSVFPDTVAGVIYQRKQFSPVASGRLSLALAKNSATTACYQAADAAMRGETTVGNRVFFRTPIPGLVGLQIGGHIFY